MKELTKSQLRIALFEPDIPQNTGSILRLAACLDVSVDIIEPCGFVFSKQRLRRSGMDYLEQVEVKMHQSWSRFSDSRIGSTGRLILFSTKAKRSYTAFDFRGEDTLLFGRESAGVPKKVHEAVDVRLTIPIAKGMRSLNVALSASMVLGEALRQTKSFPKME